MPRELKPCGTPAAALRHWRAGEPLCEACAAARREYQRGYRRQEKGPASLQPCGTAAAYRRHHLHGESPCEPCREAFADYRRGLRERSAGSGLRGPGRPRTAPCGTASGYRSHLRYGEVPCFDCMDAVAAAQRAYRARKQAELAGAVA